MILTSSKNLKNQNQSNSLLFQKNRAIEIGKRKRISSEIQIER